MNNEQAFKPEHYLIVNTDIMRAVFYTIPASISQKLNFSAFLALKVPNLYRKGPAMESDKLKQKQRVLAESIRLQRAIVDNAKAAMLDAQQSANDNVDDTEEKLFNSYREEMQTKRDMFARQYEQALDDLAILQKVTTTQEHKEADFGSMVITDAGQKLFISISLGQIKVDGDPWFAISPSAPLFKAMVGKKAGEAYEFRGQKAKVRDVF